jgi:hypothetical protein
MAFYFVSTFAIAQTPTKQPALRLSRTKNLHFAKATFPGFSAKEAATARHTAAKGKAPAHKQRADELAAEIESGEYFRTNVPTVRVLSDIDEDVVARLIWEDCPTDKVFASQINGETSSVTSSGIDNVIVEFVGSGGNLFAKLFANIPVHKSWEKKLMIPELDLGRGYTYKLYCYTRDNVLDSVQGDHNAVYDVGGDKFMVLSSVEVINGGNSIAASHGERTRGLVVPRRRRAVVLSES